MVVCFELFAGRLIWWFGLVAEKRCCGKLVVRVGDEGKGGYGGGYIFLRVMRPSAHSPHTQSLFKELPFEDGYLQQR